MKKKKQNLQTYVVIQIDYNLKICCLKCGKISSTINNCNHILQKGDPIFKVDRRKIDLI